VIVLDNKHHGKQLQAGVLITPATILLTIMFLLPLLYFLRNSFNTFVPGSSMEIAWSLKSYIEFFTTPYYTSILWNTVYISILSTVLSLILGFPIAYVIARSRGKWKGLLIMLVVFPLLIGNIIRDVGWIALFSETGMINQWIKALGISSKPIQILHTPFAVIVAITNVVLPFMVLSLQSVIEKINPALEEAAIDLGASRWAVTKDILLPLAMPGIMAGTLFVFILSMNAYTTPLIIGGTEVKMMAPALYSQISEVSNWPMGAAMAVILILMTLISSFLYLKVIERPSKFNVSTNTEVKG
jgi:putative spermidine/putrescine transport system permease protein